VRGFAQKFGVDYKETFSPTLKQDYIENNISNCKWNNNYDIHQMDEKVSYQNAKAKEDIYMEAPRKR